MSIPYFALIAFFLSISQGYCNWAGTWQIIKSCDSNTCCCPSVDTFIQIKANPNNPSQVLGVGGFDNGLITQCGLLNWEPGIEIPWPWSVDDYSFIPLTYKDDTSGVKFTILGKSDADGNSTAKIIMDQSNVGGPSDCSLTLNNQFQAWFGRWQVVSSCSNTEYCCCPKLNSYVTVKPNPNNNSEVIYSGEISDNEVCENMNWTKTEAIMPWTISDFDIDAKDHLIAIDGNGVSYNMTILYNMQRDYLSTISMNQFAAGGAAQCTFQIYLFLV